MTMLKFAYLTLALVSLTTSACTGPSLYEPLPQSQFVYPNSDVIPGGHVTGSAEQTYIMPFQIPQYDSAVMRREAYVNALSPNGGDLIINGGFSERSMMVPLFIIYIVTVDYSVEGTSARMAEVGTRPKAEFRGSQP
jgi:hypothetical protein